MKPDPIAWFNELSTLKKTFVGFFFLLTWASLGVLLGLLGALFVKSGVSNLSPMGSEATYSARETYAAENPINGEQYTAEELQKMQGRYPLAVMIENLSIVRPQSGLASADIIYEAITEGGITRFMGIFWSRTSPLGPIRSARAPFLDWLLEYDAAYAHAGGSAEALSLIPKIGVKDLDQFSLGFPTYWRVQNTGLAFEHTLYSNTDKLWEAAERRGFKNLPKIEKLKFKEDASVNERGVSAKIKVFFTGEISYIVDWEYDSVLNVYKRSQQGVTQTDKVNDEILTAKNIVVSFVKTEAREVTPGKMGVGMNNIGEGEAKIFRDGKVINATWKKKDQRSRTKFYDTSGSEIEFNRGKIWVEIVPKGSSLEFTQ